MDRLERMYAAVWEAHGEAYADLDRSLNPRSGEALYAAAAALGVDVDWRGLPARRGRRPPPLALAPRLGGPVRGVVAVARPPSPAPGGFVPPRPPRTVPAAA